MLFEAKCVKLLRSKVFLLSKVFFEAMCASAPHHGNTGCRVFKFTKLERLLPKNQHTQRKLLNFENVVNWEVSKIGHHYGN